MQLPLARPLRSRSQLDTEQARPLVKLCSPESCLHGQCKSGYGAPEFSRLQRGLRLGPGPVKGQISCFPASHGQCYSREGNGKFKVFPQGERADLSSHADPSCQLALVAWGNGCKSLATEKPGFGVSGKPCSCKRFSLPLQKDSGIVCVCVCVRMFSGKGVQSGILPGRMSVSARATVSIL